jgi:hypothetical protein
MRRASLPSGLAHPRQGRARPLGRRRPSREEILEDYPLLEAGDITAALEYAARQSDHPVLRIA